MESENAPSPGQAGTLTVDELRIVEGLAREAGKEACPACGRPIAAGQDVVTSLGDVRRGAVGVTLHRRCYAAVGRPGVLELMVAAYQRSHDC
jgi:hypothetical protein